MDIHAEIAATADWLAKTDPLDRPEMPNLETVTLPMLALNYECLKIRLDELEARLDAMDLHKSLEVLL